MDKPVNVKLTNKFKKALSQYFIRMRDKFPYQELEGIYNAKVKESVISVKEIAPPPIMSDYETWLKAITTIFGTADLKSLITSYLGNFFIQGSVQMMTYGTTKMGIPIAFEGPPMSQAVQWAQDYSAGLVTNLDIETRSQIAKVISDGIQNKRGVDGISRDLRSMFTDMSKTRADMIAQTESNRALSEGMFDKAHDMGVDGKEWYSGVDPCEEVCQPNVDAGVIPIDEPFPSGDMVPPGHPRCRCAFIPVRLDRTD
jgi:SPP1 gp7 family putative phage head morphogenesis protein